MLLAHRVPAALCGCIRWQPLPPATRLNGRDRTAGAVPVHRRRLSPLAAPAVRALSRLLHSTGPQWRPVCPMPFHEAAAAAQQRRRRPRASSPSARAAAAAAVAVDMTAAAELAASVWRQTAKQLLENSTSRADGGDGGRSNRSGSSGGGGGGGGGSRRENGGAGVAADWEAGVDIGAACTGHGNIRGTASSNALATLCGIVCDVEEEEQVSGCRDSTAGSVDDRRGGTAPFCGQSIARRRPLGDGGRSGDTLLLAALRVLLHTCRVSPGVAEVVVAFEGGNAVQALLGRLHLPVGVKADPDVSQFFRSVTVAACSFQKAAFSRDD